MSEPKQSFQDYSRKFLNKIIVFFSLILIPVLAMLLLQRYQLITVPPVLFTLLKVVMDFFIVYIIASVFLRFTVTPVINYFQSSLEVEQRLLTAKIYTYIIYLVATIFVFWRLGVDAQNLTILLGLATTGIAFALRDILMSYLAWFILLLKKPFRIGDYIKVGDDKGKVIHIGTFFVWIDDTPDNKEDYTRIPNKTFLEKPVKNLGREKVIMNFKIPITIINKSLYSKIEKLSNKVESLSSGSSQVWLEPSEDKWFVRVEFSSSFKERYVIKDEIMKEAVSLFEKNMMAKK